MDEDNKDKKNIITFSEAWKELKNSPKSLYLIFLLKFLESYSYFCIIYTLIIFLSDEYKYTDEQAGWSYGLFGMCTSFYGFIFGGYLIDNLGVKMSLCLGSVILFIGRCFLVVCTKHLHMIIILYTLLPIGTCLGIPVMQIAIRRFTNEKSRALAYSIFYAMMNVSAIFSASAIDFFRKYVIDKPFTLFNFTFELTAYRALFLSGACSTLISMILSFCAIDNQEMKFDENKSFQYYNEDDRENLLNRTNEDKEKEKEKEKDREEYNLITNKSEVTNSNYANTKENINVNTSASASISASAYAANKDTNLKFANGLEDTYNQKIKLAEESISYSSKNLNINFEEVEKKGGPCESLGEVTAQKSFWKFVTMIILLMGVRIVYRHLDATFPKYMIREFGKEIMYGSIIAINPFLIVILIPIFAPLSYQFSAYTQITFGALVTSISPFFLALDNQMWSAIMFVVILSIGEALWSPRLYEYTINITEEGKEGIYMALASSPMFIATLITGLTSGIFLETFCPEHGKRESWKMWTLIGLITLTSPILLYFFKNRIEITEEELEIERSEIKRKKIEEEEIKKNIKIQREKRESSLRLIQRVSNFNNLSIEEDKSFTLGNSIVRENEFTLCK
jgi:MFS family permease